MKKEGVRMGARNPATLMILSAQDRTVGVRLGQLGT
jgi:hypothetical protein